MPKTPPIQRDAAKVEQRHREAAERYDPNAVGVALGFDVREHPLAQAFATFERDLRPDDALREAGYDIAIRTIKAWADGLYPASSGKPYLLAVASDLETCRSAALNERNPKP